ncbi:PTH1 family peptidyl-tRNA hydrolase [Mycoplasmoides fastidiosum]|uniref:Peptidyl-tRNA hydrolase n=1 Tax=Mycoplasmoides fastidiosum TaxID=92758 RepID=A0ABU0LYH5_9BACT|nr:aminoacyl-tRNA hydrolase [Mycoplasmoides fastidiosum]MDQ0513745.1 PTH1 family peptidyl-tRNA hydrolase [Mycoplasmoides fastidiosum]UUD37834.1 aminoacyl-tRNA hydrolase [Mycoplasmoides fastidiosum]
MKIKIIFGLGNPGYQYHQTRHNAGFLMIDQLVKKFNIQNSTNEFDGECYVFHYSDQLKVILVKPQTYMNLSGQCVQKMINFFKVLHKDILVIYDDLDLNFGNLRFKKNGSAGGQKGMMDIINKIGHNNIHRIKFGIGPKIGETSNFVLSNFNANQFLEIPVLAEKVFQAVKMFLDEQQPEKIMNFLN